MRLVSMMALMTNALPVCFWQSVQWQQLTNIGGLVSRYFTAPQKHDPENVAEDGIAGMVRPRTGAVNRVR